MQEYRDRSKSAKWFENCEQELLVIGAGGISSWLTLLLSRLNCPITIYDGDSIDQTNIGGQLYKPSDINNLKVVSLQNTVRDYSNLDIDVIPEMYTKDSPTSNIILTGLDNMKARRIVFDNWKASLGEFDKAVLIDGRLNAEQYQIITVTPDRIDEYENEYLFDDSEVADEGLCTYKQTSFAAAMIAGEMTSQYLNWVVKNYTDDFANCPFFIERNLIIRHDSYKY